MVANKQTWKIRLKGVNITAIKEVMVFGAVCLSAGLNHNYLTDFSFHFAGGLAHGGPQRVDVAEQWDCSNVTLVVLLAITQINFPIFRTIGMN